MNSKINHLIRDVGNSILLILYEIVGIIALGVILSVFVFFSVLAGIINLELAVLLKDWFVWPPMINLVIDGGALFVVYITLFLPLIGISVVYYEGIQTEYSYTPTFSNITYPLVILLFSPIILFSLLGMPFQNSNSSVETVIIGFVVLSTLYRSYLYAKNIQKQFSSQNNHSIVKKIQENLLYSIKTTAILSSTGIFWLALYFQFYLIGTVSPEIQQRFFPSIVLSSNSLTSPLVTFSVPVAIGIITIGSWGLQMAIMRALLINQVIVLYYNRFTKKTKVQLCNLFQIQIQIAQSILQQCQSVLRYIVTHIKLRSNKCRSIVQSYILRYILLRP